MLGKWKIKETTLHSDCRIFKIKRSRRQSETSGYEQDFFILEGGDWVNVVPVTEDGKLVMVRQFRHGTQTETLELPGGAFNSGENAIEAGARELLEETGYKAEHYIQIGLNHPNPAIQSNTCYTVLAVNAKKVQDQMLDPAEEIEIELIDENKIESFIADQTITHGLVIVALYHYQIYKNRT